MKDTLRVYVRRLQVKNTIRHIFDFFLFVSPANDTRIKELTETDLYLSLWFIANYLQTII